MVNTTSKDIRSLIEDLQDMHKSKAEEGDQAERKGREESKKGEDSRASDP